MVSTVSCPSFSTNSPGFFHIFPCLGGYLGHKFVGLQQPCQQGLGGTDFVRAVETELELALFKARESRASKVGSESWIYSDLMGFYGDFMVI